MSTRAVPDEDHWDQAVAWLDDANAAIDHGRLDEALAHAQKSARTLARVVGETHPDHANAQLTVGRILQAQGRPQAALPHLEAASTSLARTRIDDPAVAQLRIQALLVRAHCLQELGRFDEGRVHGRAALKLAQRHAKDDVVLLASIHNQLGMLGKFSGRFAEAERHYRIALPIMRREFGAVSREVATILHNVGGLEHARERFAHGEPPARESVEIAQALLAPDDPERIAHEVAHAGLLDGLGRHAETVPIYERAIAAYTKHYGREHYEVASTLHNLASAEHELGRVREAQAHYEEAIAIYTKVRGPRHPDLALSQFNLAILHRDEGRVSQAKGLLRRALTTFQAQLGAKHPNTRAAAAELAALP